MGSYKKKKDKQEHNEEKLRRRLLSVLGRMTHRLDLMEKQAYGVQICGDSDDLHDAEGRQPLTLRPPPSMWFRSFHRSQSTDCANTLPTSENFTPSLPAQSNRDCSLERHESVLSTLSAGTSVASTPLAEFCPLLLSSGVTITFTPRVLPYPSAPPPVTVDLTGMLHVPLDLAGKNNTVY